MIFCRILGHRWIFDTTIYRGWGLTGMVCSRCGTKQRSANPLRDDKETTA